MNSWKKIIPFLALNIVISALTTMAVLWWWDAARSPQPSSAAPAALPAAAPTPESSPQSLPPLDEPVIKIESIIGPGNSSTEGVRLVRLGTGPLWLTGWKLTNQEGAEYVFPELALLKDGAFVEVYTRTGHNTPFELYWNRDKPVWRSGSTATLFDASGNTRAQYSIP